MKAIICAAALAALSACSAQQQANVDVTLTQAQQAAQKAIDLYGVAKGIAMVAEIADPSLAPAISAGISFTDPLVAKAQIALNDASADAASLMLLVQQISDKANSLTVESASVIKVVPST